RRRQGFTASPPVRPLGPGEWSGPAVDVAENRPLGSMHPGGLFRYPVNEDTPTRTRSGWGCRCGQGRSAACERRARGLVGLLDREGAGELRGELRDLGAHLDGREPVEVVEAPCAQLPVIRPSCNPQGAGVVDGHGVVATAGDSDGTLG